MKNLSPIIEQFILNKLAGHKSPLGFFSLIQAVILGLSAIFVVAALGLAIFATSKIILDFYGETNVALLALSGFYLVLGVTIIFSSSLFIRMKKRKIYAQHKEMVHGLITEISPYIQTIKKDYESNPYKYISGSLISGLLSKEIIEKIKA